MMKRQLVAFFGWGLIIVLSLSACSKEEPVDKVTFDIEKEMLLDLKEELGPDENRNLLLGIKTIQEFDCENYELNTSVRLTDDEFIRVTVTDLIQPIDCIPGETAAFGQAGLGNLSEKEYLLNLSVLYEINYEGRLSANGSYYRLTFGDDVTGVSVNNPTLYRIPSKSVWGYLQYEAADIMVAQNLLQDMQELLEVTTPTPGNYGHFVLSNANEVSLPAEDIEEVQGRQNQTFLLRLVGTVDELREKVESEYCPQYQEKVKLQLYTHTGEEITCS